MKITKLVFLKTLVVMTCGLAATANAVTPNSAWVASGISSEIRKTTLAPDTSVSGGGVDGMVTGDFNCDGYDDLVILTTSLRYGKTFIHLGSANYESSFPSNFTTSADYIISGTQSRQYFGFVGTKISDIDGDACPELVLSASKNSAGASYDTFYLYKSTTISGWTNGGSYTDADADSSLSMGVSASNQYTNVHNVGAINDSLEMVSVGESNGEYLVIGSENTGLNYVVAVSALEAGVGTVESNAEGYVGSAGAQDSIAGGDVDGNGLTDLLVGSPGNSGDNVVVIFGPISASENTFNSAGFYETAFAPGDDNIRIMADTGTSCFGENIQAIDINNDNKDEILVGDSCLGGSSTGHYYIISGLDALKGVTNEVNGDTTSGTYNFYSGHFDVATYIGGSGDYLGDAGNAVVGDFDGDGYQDALLGGRNFQASTAKGRGYVLYNRSVAHAAFGTTSFEDDLGEETLLSSTARADAYVEGANNNDALTDKTVVGDFDNDGDDEVVLLAFGANTVNSISYGEITVVEFPDDVDEDGIAAKDGDCNDSDAAVGAGQTWYVDADGDGLGATTSLVSCAQPTGYVATATDCNDASASVGVLSWWWDYDNDTFGGTTYTESACSAPTATHGGTGTWVQNSDDCDDADATRNPNTVWYADVDTDGYGGASITTVSCAEPTSSSYSYVLNASDCDDNNASVMPDTIWYADADADGFGDAAQTTLSCTQPTGYVADATDCNDAASDLNPDTTWYADADGDRFGDANVSLQACVQPTGYVADATDFNDTTSAAYPGAVEVCDDGIDNDNNGLSDNNDSTVCSNDDVDGDGITSLDGDCDDNNAAAYPGAAEAGDAADNNCNGRTDEHLMTVGVNTTSIPTDLVVGSTFDLSIDVDNQTGMENYEVVVMLPNQPLLVGNAVLDDVLNWVPINISRRSFCNGAATNCNVVGTTETTLASGTITTVSVPITVPDVHTGSYVVRVRVINLDTGEVQSFFRNQIFSGAVTLLEVTE